MPQRRLAVAAVAPLARESHTHSRGSGGAWAMAAGYASRGEASVASEGSPRDSVIKLTVRVHGRTFTIPCGDGSQDIKWLASVAAKRYELS